jgi:spermidine synthase
LVVKVATDPAYFSYLSSCQPNARIVLGDARISLTHTDAHFDLMLLDAFSSDSIPTHLLTVEAMQHYFDRLGDEGVLIVHISNRHLALAPVVARLASAVGAEAVLQKYVPDQQLFDKGTSPTHAILVSRSHDKLERARKTGKWQDLHSDGGRPWTDDYSNIIGAMIDRALGK